MNFKKRDKILNGTFDAKMSGVCSATLGDGMIPVFDHFKQIQTSQGAQNVLLDWFAYQVPVFSNLAAVTGQATNQIIIQADSDFEWVASVYEFDIAAASATYNATPIPNMLINITDTGTGRNLMNNPVPVTSIFGLPGRPFINPISRVFKANATVQFTASNFDAAVATGNLRLTLLGWKQFYMQ